MRQRQWWQARFTCVLDQSQNQRAHVNFRSLPTRQWPHIHTCQCSNNMVNVEINVPLTTHTTGFAHLTQPRWQRRQIFHMLHVVGNALLHGPDMLGSRHITDCSWLFTSNCVIWNPVYIYGPIYLKLQNALSVSMNLPNSRIVKVLKQKVCWHITTISRQSSSCGAHQHWHQWNNPENCLAPQ